MKGNKRTTIMVIAIISTFPIIYWQIDNSSIILNLLSTLGFVALCGLILGLIPFRELKYLKKISFTIPFSIIIFGLYISIVTVNYEYGVFHPYNHFTAKRDIKDGRIQLVTYGLPVDNWVEIKNITKKYGFEYVTMGCIVNNMGHEKYNDVMIEYLNKTNGKGWRNRMDKEIAELNKK